MRRVRNKRLKREILRYMKYFKAFQRFNREYNQKFWYVPKGWERNTRTRMLVRAYAFQLRRRRNDSRK